MATLVHGPLGFVLGQARNAYDWQQRNNRMRNDQMYQAHQLRMQGVSPMDALNLSRVLSYQNYGQDPRVQANYLMMLKMLGYLPYQAQ